MNPKIEKELIEFKAEIKEKFEKSEMNSNYAFPRLNPDTALTSHTIILPEGDSEDETIVMQRQRSKKTANHSRLAEASNRQMLSLNT